jgi:hypothetical protein
MMELENDKNTEFSMYLHQKDMTMNWSFTYTVNLSNTDTVVPSDSCHPCLNISLLDRVAQSV